MNLPTGYLIIFTHFPVAMSPAPIIGRTCNGKYKRINGMALMPEIKRAYKFKLASYEIASTEL